MANPWLMGFDLGGSGVRCLLVDTETGASAASARPWRFIPAHGTFGTGFDLDLASLWRAVGEASREALAGAGIDGAAVSALAVSAIRFSTVLTDDAGAVLLAVPNTDARAAGESFELAERLGETLSATTGSCALPLHAAARLAWLRKQDPQRFGRVATLYGVGEWLNQRLCGARAVDPSQGSATGLLQVARADWALELIDELALPRAIFPAIAPAGARLGALTDEAAAHLGLHSAVQVVMGGGDSQMSLLGSGVTAPGQAGVVGGTTVPLQVVLDTPLVDATGAMQTAHHALPGAWVLESNGGAMGHSLGMLARTLFPDAPQPESRLFAEAQLSEPGAAGMLSPLGADLLDMSAPTVPLGHLTLSHMTCTEDARPGRHVARAAVEGSACALRANLERLQASLAAQGAQLDSGAIALSGGLSRSDVFTQLVADITGREVVAAAPWQTSALGAVLCAGVGAGHYADFAAAGAALCANRRHFTPDRDNAAANAQLYDTWNRFRERARESTAPLAAEHLLPRMLREPAPAAVAHSPPRERPVALVSASFDEASLQRLGARMDVEYASFRDHHRLLTGPDLVAALADRQVFVTEVDVLDLAALQQLPQLRVVAACRGDAVNVDVEACSAFGIPVLFAPGRNAIAVADLAVAFMLSLARKLPAAGQFLRQPDCTAGNMGKMGQAFNQLQGVELWGKTVGLVGLGAVGRAVARRLAGFDVEILVHDPFVSPEQAALAGCRLTDLDTLLAQADFVSLHAAVTAKTTGMIGAQQLAKMKPGAFFINTARAALVDEQALVEALQQERIGGAALDTFAVEPPGFDHPLVQHPGVITTPHSAGNTREVAAHQGDCVSAALLQLLDGGRPHNVLNPQTLENFSWSGPRREPTAQELAQLAQRGGPAVTDLQRDARPAQAQRADSGERATASAEIVANMRAVLAEFCAGLAADPAVRAFSAGQEVTLHFNAYDLGLQFYFQLDQGEVHSGLGAPAHGAEVHLEMRGEILDGMFSGTIDTMECAMNGEISFMGDAAKAMTLQHMNQDMQRLYTAARAAVGDPGDLAAIPRPGSAAAPAPLKPGDIREELVAIMQELYEAQVITATGGNISVRIPDSEDQLWITPSRLFKGDLRPEVLVRINMQGESLDTGARSPSSEWCMHTRILQVKPEATAVIHAHAPNATILANAGLPFLPISTEAAFFGNIPRIPFTMPGTVELADLVGEAMQDEWAALLVNHGLIVGGRTLRRAADMVEIIERSAEIMLGCYALGKEPPVLPAQDAAHFRQLGDIVA